MFERKSNKEEPRESKPAPVVEQRPAPSPTPTPAKKPLGAKAMIGAKVKVNGDIISSEDLLVEGEVNGTITLGDHELVVGSSGKVQANISAKTVRIEGEVRGDVSGSERVVICASGEVQGNLVAPRVVLEDGGRFKGSIDMGSPKKASVSASTKPTAVPKNDSAELGINKAG